MIEVVWKPDLIIELGKGAIEIYNLDWTKWLDGDTLANTPTMVVPGGITASFYSVNSASVDLLVVPGTEGVTYTIPITVMSATHGRRDVRNLIIRITDQ